MWVVTSRTVFLSTIKSAYNLKRNLWVVTSKKFKDCSFSAAELAYSYKTDFCNFRKIYALFPSAAKMHFSYKTDSVVESN